MSYRDFDTQAVFYEQHEGIYLRERGYTEDLAVDALFDARADLAIGIHNDVQAAHANNDRMPALVRKVTYYVNGDPGGYKTEFLVADRVPDYAERYYDVRQQAFGALLMRSIEDGEFSLLLSTATELNDPVLAQMYLAEMRRKEQVFSGMYAGDAHSFLDAIDRLNTRGKRLDAALQDYARRERNMTLRNMLLDEKTTALDALKIWSMVKRDKGLREIIKHSVEGPLEIIGKQPRLEQQLLSREIKGLSIYED